MTGRDETRSIDPPPARAIGDHQLAARLAEQTGELLVELLADPAVSRSDWSLEYLADRSAHEFLVAELARHRPDDAVLSEEGDDDPSRLDASRVWIVDPLDGSSDYGWNGQWAVHVGLAESGRPIAGAVAVPALGTTYVSDPAPEPITSRVGSRPVVVVARSRRHIDGAVLADSFDAEVVAVGSAGVKAMAVVRGEADAYVHGGGLYEWDSCAPVAVAQAAGLHCSRLDGSPLAYNKADPWSPGLIICRPALADPIMEVLLASLG
jgi:3'(2'), 5'-bisphosphate nucleotidase